MCNDEALSTNKRKAKQVEMVVEGYVARLVPGLRRKGKEGKDKNAMPKSG